jgi:subtilisin-like proprotein convertase family protein
VWPDAYYAGTNEAGGGGNQTTYAFDRVNMLVGAAATMQRLAVIPPVSGYGFQTVTPADHDGDTSPPPGAPGIFMRHYDDEAHSGAPVPSTDRLEMWEMDVDWTTPANTTVTALPSITITDFNSWFTNYSTFFSVPQPASGTRLDPIREALLQRLVYRNFGSHEVLLGVLATNRDPATSGSNVEAGARWFELRRSAARGGAWTLFDEGTFGGDTNSSTANFFMGSVAMDGAGNIALGYSKTDVGASSVFPSVGIAGRLEGDSPGTMGPEVDIVAGTDPSPSGRWGDYANMSVDPENDCTFWFTAEYMPGSSWGTRVASFTFEECLFGYTLSPTPAALDVCAPTDPDPTIGIDVASNGGWSFTVDLAASGEPPGTTSSFVPDNQLPDFTSTYTLLGTGGSTTGQYVIDILGTGGDAPPTLRQTQVLLNLAVADPGAAMLTSPSPGATGQPLLPTLSWAAASDATSYSLEVATDPGFTNIVYSAAGLTGLSHVLTTPLDPSTTYHWRVSSENVCGTATSAARSFTTVQLVCQSFTSSDVPLLIPPTGTSGTTESTLTIAPEDGGTLAGVIARDLVGTHTYMGDLDMYLISPEGTEVQLFEQQCGTDEDFFFSFDDAAVGVPPCPPTDMGTYAPVNPLAALSGQQSEGDWTLRIVDNLGGDSGQLDGWGLDLCTEVREDLFADGFESGDTSAWSRTVP